jgi:hypothetical protein
LFFFFYFVHLVNIFHSCARDIRLCVTFKFRKKCIFFLRRANVAYKNRSGRSLLFN